MAARIDRSPFTCSTRSSSAAVNFFWIAPVEVLTSSRVPSKKQFRRYVKVLSELTDVSLAQLTLPAQYRRSHAARAEDGQQVGLLEIALFHQKLQHIQRAYSGQFDSVVIVLDQLGEQRLERLLFRRQLALRHV